MTSKLPVSVFVLACVFVAGAPVGAHAQTAAASQKSDAERLKYLNEQKRKIDMETERRTDAVRDGQKGLGNSGATQNKIDQIEKEQNARKKALDDNYRNNAQRRVVGLDGKVKNPGPSGATPPPSSVGLDGKNKAAPSKPAPKQSEYVVGTDGKLKKRGQ